MTGKERQLFLGEGEKERKRKEESYRKKKKKIQGTLAKVRGDKTGLQFGKVLMPECYKSPGVG